MDNLSTKELIDRLKQWSDDRVDHFNESIAGHSYLENTVAAAAISGLEQDVGYLLAICRILAEKLLELEVKVNP